MGKVRLGSLSQGRGWGGLGGPCRSHVPGSQIAVSMLTYPFLLVGDLMAVNNCGYVCTPPLGTLPGQG